MTLAKDARRRSYTTARALRAFLRGDGSDWDWAGALIIHEFIDDVSYLRKFATAYGKAMSKRPKKK